MREREREREREKNVRLFNGQDISIWKGIGHWTVKQTGTQSFINKLSYSLD